MTLRIFQGGSLPSHLREAKGRLNPYVAAVPTYVIICPLPVLLGAAALLLHEC